MAKFKTIDVPQMKQLMQDDNAMVLDCRDVRDYREGHIDNALHLHEGLRDALVMKGDKSKTMLIYCYHGHASEHVAEMFADFGFQEVYSLQGGYAVWS